MASEENENIIEVEVPKQVSNKDNLNLYAFEVVFLF